MMATGAAILLTLPFVSRPADWLHVGQLAADAYAVDRNWIFLSRDLFGIPRRMFQTYVDGRAVQAEQIAANVGWALWATVVGVTLVVSQLRLGRRPAGEVPLTGPLAAFAIFGAWLCTYRFMYYDSLIAALGVVVLMADPRPFFRKVWRVRAVAPILVGLLLLWKTRRARTSRPRRAGTPPHDHQPAVQRM